MAPFLLLGFLVAGLLHSFVPGKLYGKWLSGNGLKSVLLSIAIGVPLPLCSCGVIPTAVSIRRRGASKASTTAFLISTPQTGVDSIAATWSVLGLPFAVLRPLVAMVTGLFGGLAAGAVDKDGSDERTETVPAAQEPPEGFAARCRETLRYGFFEMMEDIGLWLFIGLVVASLITVLVPDDFFVSYSHSYILNLFLILLVAAPMYVCATGSIPIAAALMLKGLSPGAALVFLMAGPATNVASILVLGKTLGKKNLIVYLVSIVLGAVFFGVLTDMFLPAEWFALPMASEGGACCHGGVSASVPWWQAASSVILVCLIARALFVRFGLGRRDSCHDSCHGSCNNSCHDSCHDSCHGSCQDGCNDSCNDGCNDSCNDSCHGSRTTCNAGPAVTEYSVRGMACSHCVASVQSHLETLPGAISVSVDLASGTARVEGAVPPELVVSTVRSLGYDCNIAEK
ncbi:MAG: permease [Bacteroidales bacterium]|nr:permease [Bacteroidales bacterium]